MVVVMNMIYCCSRCCSIAYESLDQINNLFATFKIYFTIVVVIIIVIIVGIVVVVVVGAASCCCCI